jgi:membrane associated rhomboid family serine protease
MPPMPPITQALLLLNVGFFCLQFFVGGLLVRFFALWPLGDGFLPWQVFSYSFLHGGIGHLFFNMLGLWMFGAELERLWGPKRFMQFYGASVLAAALTQLVMAVLTGSSAYTVGASGGLYGLLLAYALSFPRRQFDLVGVLPMFLVMSPFPLLGMIGMLLYVLLLTNRSAIPIPPISVPAMIMVTIFGAVELLAGMFLRTGIAHFAHLGGMLGGYLMIRYWRGQSPFGKRR